jgi:hypothetical protein
MLRSTHLFGSADSSEGSGAFQSIPDEQGKTLLRLSCASDYRFSADPETFAGEFGITGRLVTATPATGEAVKVLFLRQSYLGAKSWLADLSSGRFLPPPIIHPLRPWKAKSEQHQQNCQVDEGFAGIGLDQPEIMDHA